MALYASLADVLMIINAQNTADSVNQRQQLLSALRNASRRVDGIFSARRPLFEPVLDTRSYPVTSVNVDSWLNVFYISDPLLALSAVTFGSISNPVSLTPGAQVSVYPPNYSPSRGLRLTQTSRSWYQMCNDCATGGGFVNVTGVFGIHRDYASAWVDLDVITDTAVTTTTQTTVVVANANGDDEYGFTPRFSPGQLIRIDSEYMEVTQVNYTTDVLTVRRGQNGTTAATHAIGAAVAVWRPEEVVRRAVARQAGLLYARLGAYTTVSVEPTGTEVRYPSDLLVELRSSLQEFAYGT
jgi:hypothetical protein